MELKKIISIALIILVIVTLTGMALNILTSRAFWLSVGIASIFAWLILPRLK